MAKRKDEAPTIEVSKEDLALAKRAIMDCTGCGEPDAEARMQKLGDATIAKIAELEKDNKRVEIVTLLFS